MIHVLAKVPRAHLSKTRLIPALGPEGAAALSAAMTADVLAALAGLPVTIWVAGPDPLGWRDTLPFPWRLQPEGDLGAKLSHALHAGGTAIGTDCVTLNVRSLSAVRDADLHLGLSDDGGYTFVTANARAVAAGVFSGVLWSAPTTASSQLARATVLGLSTSTEAGGFDVDTPADLERLRELLRREPHPAPRTRELLGL